MPEANRRAGYGPGTEMGRRKAETSVEREVGEG